MQDNLLKSNFIGRDGFLWWIGQIPQESAHGDQINGAGWGNRYKVRIMGYHPYSTVELPDKDLPWAHCLLPTTSGTGAANYATDVKLSPGDVVFGFFLDGDDAQIPVIMSAFGRTDQVPSNDFIGAFQPFTGFTSKIKSNGGVKPDQSLQQNAETQKSPRHVPQKQANQIGSDEISFFGAIGDTVQLATASTGKTIDKITTEVTNLLNKIQNGFTVAKNEINRIVDKIVSISSGLVGSMMSNLYKKLAPMLNKGLDLLYKQVYALVLSATANPIAAHLAGVAAQTAMVTPIKLLQESFPCVTNTILNSLGSAIKPILNSVVDNVQNFVSGAGIQFAGAMINDIISKISGGLQSAIGGVSNILKFFSNFSVDNFLRSAVEGLAGLGSLLNCNQNASNSSAQVNKWIIGKGPQNNPDIPFASILEAANVAKGISQIPLIKTLTAGDSILSANFLTSVISNTTISSIANVINLPSLTGISVGGFITSGNEIMKILSFDTANNEVVVQRGYSGISTSYDSGTSFNIINTIPEESLTKQVEPSTFNQQYGTFDIFGPDTKNPNILNGCYTGPPTSCDPPTINIFGSNGSGATAIPLFGAVTSTSGSLTGSIIGVKITNPGSGYDFPPFVEIVDNCNQGYGGIARSIINDKGELESIYIVSEGENYPVSTIEPYVVTNVIIQDPGQNYSSTDTAKDNLGNEYKIEVVNGYINKIQPINTIDITDLPIIEIKSTTGSGAILKPILDVRPTFQGEVKQVIDCVT
jgi:hypothetical protein